MSTTVGYYSTATPSVLAVSGSSQQALAANQLSQYRLFINDSANVMYLSLGGTAVLNTGIRLNANGGTYEMSLLNGNLFRGAITAIGTTGNLIVIEGN